MNMKSIQPHTLGESLEHITSLVIDRLTGARKLGISEGTVMTPGPPPYRRLDCGGRALAYIRERPRKRARCFLRPVQSYANFNFQ